MLAEFHASLEIGCGRATACRSACLQRLFAQASTSHGGFAVLSAGNAAMVMVTVAADSWDAVQCAAHTVGINL